MLRTCPQVRFSPATIKIKSQGCALRRFPKGDRKALWSRPQARNPCFRESPTMSGRHTIRSRPSDATICKEWIKRLGALLRERKVTGRDASLPAPLLIFPLEWSPVKQLGRCPKPHKGRRPLTPQGGLPLDPFLCPGLSLLPYFFFSGAFFAFSFAFFS